LKKNHTLYGIHYQGNCGQVDGLGFLHAVDSIKTNPRMQHLERKIQGTRPFEKVNFASPVYASPKFKISEATKSAYGRFIQDDSHVNMTQVEDQCWVCESWVESIFHIDIKRVWPDLDFPKDGDPVNLYIHFDFDNF